MHQWAALLGVTSGRPPPDLPVWPDPRHLFSTPSPAFCCLWCPHILQGLLKEKLELEKVKKKDGRTRVTLKPIEDQLTFDKVNRRNTIVISTPGQ